MDIEKEFLDAYYGRTPKKPIVVRKKRTRLWGEIYAEEGYCVLDEPVFLYNDMR